MNQEQTQGEQSQKQQIPDPVWEQRQAYSAPENAIASDPITEVTTEEPPKEEPKEEEKKE